MQNNHSFPRRNFLRRSAAFAAAVLTAHPARFFDREPEAGVGVDAHCWVYASKFPPDWDATPVLGTVFREIKAAGFDRLELMESILRHPGAVPRIKALITSHALPVGGCSYYGDFWDKEQQPHLLEDIKQIVESLHAVGATMIGLTVGDAERRKTEAELDLQAESLRKVRELCIHANIVANLHNHTFEVSDGMHDLKGTLSRLPDFPLGPDLNWLVRAGVDPVAFIQTYGHQMVYMHLRDQDAAGKWTEALGEGVIDFTAIAAALKNTGYRGRAAVELAFDTLPARPVQQDWTISRQYVKRIFNW